MAKAIYQNFDYKALGHYWCAYVTFKESENEEHSPDLLDGNGPQGRFHWGKFFDCGLSCMNTNMGQWFPKDQSSGTFFYKRLDIFVPEDDEKFIYTPLDLYLMGLRRSEQVGPLRLLRDVTPAVGSPVTAKVETISINQITDSCGNRVPPAEQSPRAYKMAMVVIGKNEQTTRDFAIKLNSFRGLLEKHFAKATGGPDGATLSTKIP